MPHTPIDPSNASQYDRTSAVEITLPAGKRAEINITFSNPLHENSATVFDLSQSGVGIAHRNNQHSTPPYPTYGPFLNDAKLLIVAAHKDGAWSPSLPRHQSWIRTYRQTATEVRVGSSDAGTPAGTFNDAHAQITVEIV